MKKRYKIIIVITILLPVLIVVKSLSNKENDKLFVFENTQTIFNNSKIPKDYSVQFAKDNNIEADDVIKYKINEKYTNYYSNDNRKSSLIDNKSNEKIEIEEVLIDNKSEQFYDVINEQVKIKYPSFIANEVIKETTKKEYLFDNTGIKIYFYEFNTNPVYEEEVFVKLTCDMIKGVVDSICNVNPNINPNIPVLDPNKKTIALTFDDGPNYNTSRVLQILNDNKASATFFMLGTNMKNFPKIVKEVADSNNEIASHTYSHKSLTKLNDSELKYEIDKPEEILAEITDKEISFIRPPYGNVNKKVKKYINKPIILWSVDPQDWRFKNGEVISQNILNEIKDGDIILLHDIHSTTADALELILPQLYIEGYQVVSVGELASLKQIKLENGTIYRNFN